MYLKELQMLDENTVKYMMDKIQAENDGLRAANDELQSVIDKLQSERDELLRRLESPDFSRKDAHL